MHKENSAESIVEFIVSVLAIFCYIGIKKENMLKDNGIEFTNH